MSTRDALLPASAESGSLSDQHLSKLRELYIEQNKSAAEVEEIMKKNHPEFPILDTNFYKNGLHALGLVKKISLQQWVAVQAGVLKRKREGKETDVYLSGQLQPQEKIDRIIKRSRKGPQMLNFMARGPTPELPAHVSLRTPTIPTVVIPIPEVPYTKEGAIYHFEQLSHRVQIEMMSNPNSTVQLLTSAPTSQFLLKIFGRDGMGIIDQRAILNWVGADANKLILRAIFALDLPGADAAWARLIRLSADLKSEAAFRSLVEFGLETHNKEWIRRHAVYVLESAIKLGSKEAGQLITTMFPQPPIWDAHTYSLISVLWNNIERLDFEMISEFVTVGVRLNADMFCDPESHKKLFNAIVQFLQPLENRQKRVDLLESFGIDFDTCFDSSWVVDDVFMGLSHRRFGSSGGGHDTNLIPLSILDHLCYSGEDDIYGAIVGHSKAAKTEITIPGLILAARSGIRQLQLYIDSRPAAVRHFFIGLRSRRVCHVSREVLLEAALSLAAGLGDVVAIASFCEAGVDPNAFMLLSHTKRPDWNPLVRAAGGKHLVAVTKLIQMGADPESNTDGFNPLSAAIWSPQLLSDTKQFEKLETIKYLLGILSPDFIRANGAEALIRAVVPPRDFYHICPRTTPSCICRTRESSVPDKAVIGMLLEAGVELNGIVAANMDPLYLAIGSFCNLETVDVLIACGAQIHSRPCAWGETIFGAAVRSESPDRLRIIELLLRSNAGIIKELNTHAILEALLPSPAVRHPICSGAEPLLLSLSLLRPWPEVVSWTPLVARLISYEASDELINQAIKSGANINTPDSYKMSEYTPLQLAVLTGRLNVAYQLLQQGADINAPASRRGHTVLQAACDPAKNVEIPLGFIRYLIDKSANINACDGPSESNATALHFAVYRGSNQVLCALLDAGANVHALSGRFRLFTGVETSILDTALDTAAAKGRLDMVYLLLNKGAQSYEQRNTPFDGAIKLAVQVRHFAIAKMIKAFARSGTC
ncbi:hypothetical protein O1611_g4350 [Lasiodiplodia mahajangana]|uniref:Uncharacterized protein n=1 Tax=Lasiodiplodia mahajangana TaxID=1108764 RepID=A0ACC2JPV9_9PEZI|nr:hypothetical protein O1611_g4350 [Lasiodiplodia mahajangana]